MEELFTSRTEGKSRALVVGGGGTFGAFGAGFLSTFCRAVGPDFFGAIYASSVGVYQATFYASNQPDTMEKTWREYISKIKLVKPLNVFVSKPVLNLEGLTEIYKNDTSRLDTKALMRGVIPVYVLTDLETGKAVYRKPSSEEEIFTLMEASCALPIRKPLSIDGRSYVDGGLSRGYPISKALEDGHGEILVLSSRPSGFQSGLLTNVFPRIISSCARIMGQKVLSDLCIQYNLRLAEADALVSESKSRVELVEPEKEILNHILDNDHNRLNATFSLGSEHAATWLLSHGY